MQILYYCLALSLLFVNPSYAQMLDEEEVEETQTFEEKTSTDDSDELFEEAFKEHIEKEENIKKELSFEENIDNIAKDLKEKKDEFKPQPKKEEYVPLSGDLLIGVTKDSFKISKDMIGTTKCFFGVTLKSGLNKDIKRLGLRLIWQNRAFAFLFRDVPANGGQERFITTSGKYCYNLSGVPDIDVNLCQIKGEKGEECAKRLTWNSELQSPDPDASPY